VEQGSGVLRLGLEPGLGIGLMGINGVQHLDSDRPGQDSIGGPPYLAESPGADLFIKRVTTIQERRGNGHQRPLPSPPVP
jgi:hypothetical protein